jgi:hypothetical protein
MCHFDFSTSPQGLELHPPQTRNRLTKQNKKIVTTIRGKYSTHESNHARTIETHDRLLTHLVEDESTSL